MKEAMNGPVDEPVDGAGWDSLAGRFGIIFRIAAPPRGLR